MTILIAPDKFKGSLKASEVAAAIQRGIKQFDASIHCKTLPLADGGEGSLEILHTALNLKRVPLATLDPLGRKIDSYYLVQGKEAFIEVANSSGLQLLQKSNQNPWNTSTQGTGLEIRHAIEQGARKIHLFLGGSSTNDAGLGISSALGYIFKDKSGNPLPPTGGSLVAIHNIELVNPPIKLSEFSINCYVDVDSPFYGSSGAAYIYAAQKGANRDMILQLDNGLRHYAKLMEQYFDQDIQGIKGSGAAGGIAGGLFGLFNMEVHSGIDYLLEMVQFREALKEADFVLTGEGKYDDQSDQGKVVTGVQKMATSLGKKCGLFAGTIDQKDKASALQSFSYVDVISDRAANHEDAMQHAASYLESMALDLCQTIFFQ